MPSTEFSVLFVSESEDDFCVTRDLLSSAKRARFVLHWEPVTERACAAMERSQFDAYLLAEEMVWDLREQSIRHQFRSFDLLPTIVFAERYHQQRQLEFLDCGVASYLVKETVNASVLETTILQVIHSSRSQRDRRAQEAQYLQTQRLESLSLLAGGLANDFNNQLTAILGNTRLLLNEFPANSSQAEMLKEIEEAAVRAEEATRNLLAFSRKSKAAFQRCSVPELVADTLRLLERSIPENIVINSNLRHDVPDVLANPTQLRQVVVDLVINAAEALEGSSGLIAVKCERSEADSAELRKRFIHDGLAETEYISLCVSDTGCGMDERTLKSIFDPFYSTKLNRRGLGLSALFGVVCSHRGGINVESVPGFGTRVTIVFPKAAPAHEEKPLRGPPQQVLQAHGATILVVDDEAAVQRLTEHILRNAGFNVVTASDGKEGLRLFRENRQVIRCVLLDQTMPYMSGEELLSALREEDKTVPVILTSGYSDIELEERVIEKGATGFLAKPFTSAVLLEKIQRVLKPDAVHS